MSDQDIERLSRAFGALWAEQQAHHLVLIQVLGFMAQNPAHRPAIKDGFERALSVAQKLAENPPDADNPLMGVKVLGKIEEIHATIFGQDKPKKGVV
jgi:hypothetical protein